MLLTGAMFLDYFGYDEQARLLARAIREVYQEGEALTIDQGGKSSTEDFVSAVRQHLLVVA